MLDKDTFIMSSNLPDYLGRNVPLKDYLKSTKFSFNNTGNTSTILNTDFMVKNLHRQR